MANILKMAKIQSIRQLHAAGWSQRRIARELEVDRSTVARYLRPPPPDPKPAIPPTGSVEAKPASFVSSPGPLSEDSGSNASADSAAQPNAAIPPAGSPIGNLAVEGAVGRPSHCQPLQDVILAKLAGQLSAQRIWQDLRSEHHFTGSYDSVKRFVRRLGAATPLAFRRIECAAGQEAQIDFGTGAPVITAEGKRRKTYVFRIVLSHSRKGYSEATFTQMTEDFIRCLENAFAYFGGVPQTLVIDNLKAAVAHPDWFDPELTPKVESFCRHYGATMLPTKPYLPRHKGKIESGIKYVKNNSLKGRSFKSLDEQNRHLAQWEETVADTRIHGTTKRQVRQLFESVERAALQPLPVERFPFFHEGRRKVNRDGHVEVAKAYYSTPTEYLGREVWARWDSRLVRLFNHRWQQIAVHVRHEQGRFSTHAGHVAREKINGLEKGVAYLLSKVAVIGEQCQQWAEAMVAVRGIAGTRVLQGLLALTKKHSSQSLEKACEIALAHGCWQLKTIRRLVGRAAAKQEPLPFLDEHPLIRPLEDYAAVVARAIHRPEDRPSMSEGFSRHDWTKATASAQQKSLAAPSPAPQGSGGLLPPRSGYPLSGCSSAEPDSVSPDRSTVVTPCPSHQESPYE